MKNKKAFDISADDYIELNECYGGICLACGEYKWDGCEPDAENYECEECGKNEVMGIENALIQMRINMVD
jgi:hypothetical protein